MNKLSKLAALSALVLVSASSALADEIDLAGPGTFNSGIYVPAMASPTNQFTVTSATGIFMTFIGGTPVFYGFNDATVPTTDLFSVENLAATETLTFRASSESIVNPSQILFTGTLFENGSLLSNAVLGFSENPLNSSGTEDAITMGATPEPGSLLLFGTGLAGMAWIVMRRRRSEMSPVRRLQ